MKNRIPVQTRPCATDSTAFSGSLRYLAGEGSVDVADACLHHAQVWRIVVSAPTARATQPSRCGAGRVYTQFGEHQSRVGHQRKHPIEPVVVAASAKVEIQYPHDAAALPIDTTTDFLAARVSSNSCRTNSELNTLPRGGAICRTTALMALSSRALGKRSPWRIPICRWP